MRAFSGGASFDTSSARLSLTIAANDFQRDLLLPGFYRRVAAKVQRLDLRIIPSLSPTPALLREDRADFLITPLPPSGIDIVQKRLLQDQYVCYYDPRLRSAPATTADYLGARHITVIYAGNERLDFDRKLEALGLHRDIAISVPSFSGVAAFLRGSDMLASMPSLLASGMMRGFASVRIPLPARAAAVAKLPMFMVWHQRYQKDPAHLWLRQELRLAAGEAGSSQV